MAGALLVDFVSMCPAPQSHCYFRHQGHDEVRTVLPRREDLSGDRGVLIVAYASHKKKAYSFFLLQVRKQPDVVAL